MSKELELYKAFIDGLVERKDSMTALWVKGDGFPKTEDNKAKNPTPTTILRACTMTSSAVATVMSGRNNRRCDRCITKNTITTLPFTCAGA